MCSISNGKILRHSLTDVVNIDCAHSIYRIIVFFYLFIACNIPYKCQWKRWRNCCLGNNNNHFGIIVTHVGNCVSVCVCNEVVLVNTKCAPEKRSVAIVNVVRLTTIWRLIKGIRLHIWREWQTQWIGGFVRFGGNFGGRKVLRVRSKISQNEFYSFFFCCCCRIYSIRRSDQNHRSRLKGIFGCGWMQPSITQSYSISVVSFRVIQSVEPEHPIWPCEMNECFGTWIVQIN